MQYHASGLRAIQDELRACVICTIQVVGRDASDS
jgi:hypothetical protein